MHLVFIFAKWGNAILDGGWYLMSYELPDKVGSRTQTQPHKVFSLEHMSHNQCASKKIISISCGKKKTAELLEDNIAENLDDLGLAMTC